MAKSSENKSKVLDTKKIDYFTKSLPQAREYFGERAALIFGHLEFLYKLSRRPFYKFIIPCKHSLCKEGDTFSEELILNKRAILRGLDKFRTSYKSKPLYLKALEELGEHGVFKGMPYLCYQDRHTNLTWYLRNDVIIKEILDRKWGNLTDTLTDKVSDNVSDNLSDNLSANLSLSECQFVTHPPLKPLCHKALTPLS